MKYLKVIFLLLLVGCKSEKKVERKNVIIENEEIKEIVAFLASDNLKGRDTGTEGINEAALFIEEKFRDYGVEPYFNTFKDNFEFQLQRGDSSNSDYPKIKEAFNVVGYIEGNDENLKNEFIILGAHYDHIGFGKQIGNDSIANGANDNATGSSAVITLARYFAERKTNKRSILFCLFSAEEYGLRGSEHLAEQLKSDGFNLYAMVNFEMIGVPMIDKDYKAYITGYKKSNMAEKINEYINTNLVGFLPQAQEYQLFRRSDNYPFFQEFNLPSQTISTFDFTNFSHYHGVGDEAEMMNYEFMSDLVNNVAPAIEMMSQTPTQEIKIYDN